jgi:hypothetical protein
MLLLLEIFICHRRCLYNDVLGRFTTIPPGHFNQFRENLSLLIDSFKSRLFFEEILKKKA